MFAPQDPASEQQTASQPAAAVERCHATAVAGPSQPAAAATLPAGTPGTAVPERCHAAAVAGPTHAICGI